MQQELEELKQVQMEKQLQLKEAATRQKLLALKQQLKSDTRMQTMQLLTGENICASDATGNRTVNLPVTPKTAQSEITKTDDSSVHLSMSMDGKWPSTTKYEKIKPHQLTTMKENNTNTTTIKQDKRLKYQTSMFSSLLPNTFKPTSADDKSFTTERKPAIFLDDTKPATSPCKHETPTQIDKPKSSNENIKNDADTLVIATTNTNTTATATSCDKPVVKHKLAVPDMVKETEYMSALNKQKARVSKIRRAIHAAEVIQKAWRRYKQIHS